MFFTFSLGEGALVRAFVLEFPLCTLGTLSGQWQTEKLALYFEPGNGFSYGKNVDMMSCGASLESFIPLVSGFAKDIQINHTEHRFSTS